MPSLLAAEKGEEGIKKKYGFKRSSGSSTRAASAKISTSWDLNFVPCVEPDAKGFITPTLILFCSSDLAKPATTHVFPIPVSVPVIKYDFNRKNNVVKMINFFAG